MNGNEFGTVDADSWGRRHRLLYEIELSTLYHRKRERMYDTVDRTAKAVAVIGGSAAVGRLLGDGIVSFIAATIAATSALSLVFNFSERARRHAELAKSFGELGAELVGKGETRFEDKDLDVCESKIRMLEASEPGSMGALVRICQNEMAVAQGHPDLVSRIPWYQHLLAHVWDFPAPPRPFAPRGGRE